MSSYRSVWYMLLAIASAKEIKTIKTGQSEDALVKQAAKNYLKARGYLIEKLSLKLEVLDDLYANTAKARRNLGIEKIILSTIIEHHKLQKVDLKTIRHYHKVNFIKVNLKDNRCTMSISVEEFKRYKHFNKDTILRNDSHVLQLLKQDGKWYVEAHEYEDDFKDVLNNYKAKLNVEELEKAKDTYLSNVRNSIEHETMRQGDSNRSKEDPYLLNGHYNMDDIKPYNPDEAVKYALEYALEPNPNWHYYEKMGGDCTNFTSQCLYMGGIPFNEMGSNVAKQWYWYSDSYRTPSWTSSAFFLDYILANRKVGLVAHLGDREDLRLGDMVQLGKIGKTTHSMIVTKYVYSKIDKDNIIDYLVCQHSDNARNLPLSTKPLPRIYILIDGYKEI